VALTKLLEGNFMEIFDSLNLYLHSHPTLLAEMVFLFRIKAWLLFGLAMYFVFLMHRTQKKEQAELAKRDDNFMA
jgi:type II secretory pathway component PulF